MKVPCTHWSEHGKHGGRCAVRNMTVSRGVCMGECSDYDGPERTDALKLKVLPSQGLGDLFAKGIHMTTLGLIKPCGGCKKRQAKWNAAAPYGVNQ